MLNKDIKCVYCDNKNINFIDQYKYEIEKDSEYLGIMNIYECINCKFSFSHPMPDEKKIDYFYSKIYRSKLRPHHYDVFYKKNSYLDEINMDYLSYLTTLINFENIESVLDFGTGLGNLGFALKNKFKHLKLYSCETDEHCIETLNTRGYTNYDNLEQINIKFDLIISLHAIEHLTNLNPVIKLKSLLSDNGYIFIEVPNNDFNTIYRKRIFDSPHLLFFTKEFIGKLFMDLDMRKVSLIYTSYSIEDEINNQLYSFSNSNSSNIFVHIKNFIKTIEPDYLVKIRRKLQKIQKINNEDKLMWYLHGTNNSRCIRALYMKI